MKEIKFRVWRNSEKRMYPEITALSYYQNKISGWSYYGYDFDKKDDDVIMQYTGLNDRYGKEIYEGDIVKVPVLFFIYQVPNNPNRIEIKTKYIKAIISNIYGDLEYILDEKKYIKKELEKKIIKNKLNGINYKYLNEMFGKPYFLKPNNVICEDFRLGLNSYKKFEEVSKKIGNIYENPELLEK